MLMQSRDSPDAATIHLLPPLPAEWPEGRIVGLRARGEFEVDPTGARGAADGSSLCRQREGIPAARGGNTARWTGAVAYPGAVKTYILTLLLAVAALATPAQNEAAIRALEAKWDAENLRGDAAALDSLFADSFIATDSDGVVRQKAEVVGELKAGRIKYTAAKSDELRVILHSDAAVVSGRWTGTFTHNGKTTNLRERFTNFYARLKGQWRCVASHGSAIR
jgi:ketosteroid isomerase-like protein